MNLAITLLALAAQIAIANEPPESIQIGRPVHEVRIGASTQPFTSPLDSTVTLELLDGTLASLLDEVGKQTKTEYILVQGVGQCPVSAFIRGMTAREFLQLTLEVGGLTYQSAGRSGRYIVTRRSGGPVCQEVINAPEGTCSALDSKKISAQCKNGSLSSLVKLLYGQTDGSFLVWNEAVNQPITIKLKKVSLTKAIESIAKQHSIEVKRVGKKDSFLFVAHDRKKASEQEIKDSTASAHVGLIYQAPHRDEPPANPTFQVAEWHSELYKKADAILLVSVKKRGGSCDKYCEDVLHVERVWRNVSKKPLRVGDDIQVRSYSWTSKPPANRFQVFVKSTPESDAWQLVQDSRAPSWDGVGTPCNDKGGRLHESCQMPDLACVTPYSDGGKECRDRSDCQGACILEVKDGSAIPKLGTETTGACKRDDFPCGCFTEIVGGKTTQGVCTD